MQLRVMGDHARLVASLLLRFHANLDDVQKSTSFLQTSGLQPRVRVPPGVLEHIVYQSKRNTGSALTMSQL
jgi:hypothetical protein